MRITIEKQSNLKVQKDSILDQDKMSSTSVRQLPRRSKSMVQTWSSGQSCSEVNVAIVGALGVGKSALTVKYITRRFISEYDPDLEDTYCKNQNIDQREITVRIMDTCDKSNKDPERYLKWADAFLVVYSITSRPTFEVAHNYLESIAQHHRKASAPDTPTILVGNKVDMERYRQVTKSEGTALASHYDSAFFETTAAEEYDCIESVFHEVIREVLREYERSMPLRPLYISEEQSGSGLRGIRSLQPVKEPATSLPTLLPEKNSRFKFFNRGKAFKSIF